MSVPSEGRPKPRTTRRYLKAESSYARSPFPDAWDGLLAEPALAPLEVQRSNGEAGALYHDAAAFRAPGILGRMAGNITDIYVIETLGVADGLGAFEGWQRGGRKVLQQVLGMEAREVQRNVPAEFRFDPAGEAPELLIGIVQSRHHQVDHFVPCAELADGDQSVQYRLELAVHHLFVVLLGEALEVDLDGVHAGAQLFQRLFLDIAAADDHASHPRGAVGRRRIQDVFAEDHRFAVGIGDGGTLILAGQTRQVLRRNEAAVHLFRTDLGDVPVLAHFAIDIAARRSHRECHAAREEMEQGLLFDGIGMGRADARIYQRVVRAATVFAHAAIAAFAVVDHALAGAKLALDLFVRQLLVESRLDGEPGIALRRARCQARKRQRLKKEPAIHGVIPPLRRSASDRLCRAGGGHPPRSRCRAARGATLAAASSPFRPASVPGSASRCSPAPPGRAPPSGRYTATTIAAYRMVRLHTGPSARRRWSAASFAGSAVAY